MSIVLGSWAKVQLGDSPKAHKPTAGIPVVYAGTDIAITEATPWSHAVPSKIGASQEQNTLIAWAYDKWRDEKFIYLLEAESGMRNIAHDNSKNVVGTDHGYCGINDYWHPEIVNDKRFSDDYWQLEQCYKLYSTGTVFYGINHISKVRRNFVWETV